MKIIDKKSKLHIVYGDLFDKIEDHLKAGHNGSSIIVPHVCNNVNSFGTGFAAAVAHHYPIVKENYHLLGNKFLKDHLGYVQFVEVLKISDYNHKLIFANMIAQNGTIGQNNTRPLNYFALVKCMANVRKYIMEHFQDDKVQIRCPKFGCGLAGGEWRLIEKLIEDIWFDQTTVIYAYKK
jgi:hypothetical protein